MKSIAITLIFYLMHFTTSFNFLKQILTQNPLRYVFNKNKNIIPFSNNNIWKQYKSINQAKFRMITLKKNVKNIQNLNANPNVSYPQGLTYYSDYSQDEFNTLILNPHVSKTPQVLMSYPDWTNNSKSDLKSAFYKKPNIKFMNPFAMLFQLLKLNTQKQPDSKPQHKHSTKKISSKQSNKNKTSQKNIQLQYPPKGVIKSQDWRKQQRISHVKMQGDCGNCYSYSTTGAIEGAYMIKHKKKNISYSDQQITDCCTKQEFGCNGCNGGWQWQAMRYIAKYGIVSQNEYPTISSDSGQAGTCQKLISPTKVLNAKIPFTALQPGNTTALYQAVSKQPVAVGIDASNMQFVLSQDSTKIFTNCSSKAQDANHAMLVVGYDESGNWILKNSWSTFWGDKGYIKIKSGNTCGISNFAVYANIV